MSADTIQPGSDQQPSSEEASASSESEEIAGMATMAEEDEAVSADMEEIIATANKQTQAKIVRLLPVHAAPAMTTPPRRLPSRARIADKKPTQTDLDYHALMAEQRDKFIAASPVVDAVRKHVDSADMLRLIKEQLACEAAALEWQRNENQKQGKDTAQVSSRRIEALKKMADLEVDIKKMGADTVNLKSEKFQRVFKYLIANFQEVCVEIGLRPEQIDLLFNRLATALEGWEDKAAELVR